MNRWDIREKIGFTDDLCKYIKNIGEIIEAYPILKTITVEDAEQWLKDRQFRIDQEIENELVDGESKKENREIEEINEILKTMSENTIDIKFVDYLPMLKNHDKFS